MPTSTRSDTNSCDPHELRAIVANRPVVYVPLGTYEWHGEHLPVGLDALTAHGVCLRAAARDGGVVLPPLYYGTGGGHSAYPWTVMMQTDAEISALVSHTLGRLQEFGFRLAVLFSGHFAPTQLEMIGRLAADWNAAEGPMQILSIGVNQIEGLALAPDHAALFETTLLAELHPDRVAVDLLPPMTGGPDQKLLERGKARSEPRSLRHLRPRPPDVRPGERTEAAGGLGRAGCRASPRCFVEQG